MNSIRAVLLTALLLAPAYCQDKEAKSLHLTMPKAEATLKAFTKMGELLSSEPALRKQFKALETSLADNEGDEKLGIMVKRLAEKNSRFADVFSKAGIEPQEAAATIQVLMAAAVGDAMLQPGQPIPNDMDPILADNLRFFRQHKEELAPPLRNFQDLNAKVNEDDQK